MEYFLVHLSYTASGWRHITQASQSFDSRLDPVRRLLTHLGGSFAKFHFGDGHVVADKFSLFGSHDLMAVVAMPDKVAAQAFRIAVASQDGVADVRLSAMMPFEHAVTAAAEASRLAVAATDYAGPGGTTHR